jgi:hypothetical protein
MMLGYAIHSVMPVLMALDQCVGKTAQMVYQTVELFAHQLLIHALTQLNQ